MFIQLSMILLVSLLNRVKGIDSVCNGTVVGRVRNRKLNELSGLAESHRFPGIFYAIEDSGNEPVVYIVNKDGSLKGEIILQGIRNNDFEDIAISSGHNGYFIYVGDIGNDWPNHCQGINQTQRMVHKIAEPYSNQYENGVKIIIPLAHITTFVLRDTILNCREDMKEDTETLFIDPLYHAGYIVQKVRPRNIKKEPIIFKFDMLSGTLAWIWTGLEWVYGIDVELKRVGYISSSSVNQMNTQIKHPWPTFITGGDISSEGHLIILRGFKNVRVWERNTMSGESVEEILSKKEGKIISVCHEAQGESVAISNDNNGFFTVSEAKGENESRNIDIPTYYYSFDNGPSVNDNPFTLVPKREKEESKSWKEAVILPQKSSNDIFHEICTCTNSWFYKPAFQKYLSFLPVKVSNIFHISI